MKKKLAIYLSMLTLFFATSCINDTDDVVLSPYAMIKSFSIGNIKSQYPAFTETGEDTVVTKTIQGSSYSFVIDQAAGKVYNADSLPYATNVEKLLVDMQVSGYASIYVDSTGLYDYFSSTDSIDFSYPRKFRITSADGGYCRDYTVSVNVHQVEPELMVWNKYSTLEGVTPLRVIEHDGAMCLFGEKDGQWVLATASQEGAPDWQQVTMDGLPATARLETMQSFGGALYVVAADGVYMSADAAVWSLSYSGNGLLAIVGASDADGKMWVASDKELFVTANGTDFESAGALPAGFPLYGVSIASYVMNHNKSIVRYMLVGYATEAMDGNATVWSRLSVEDGWAKYENDGNPFPCPSLKGLSVVDYNGGLYAFGGAGVVQGENVKAFSSFYISMDNGITWKNPDGFYQRLPNELAGNNAPFAVAVDSRNVMWIICAGDRPAIWKGIINRLGFKDK